MKISPFNCSSTLSGCYRILYYDDIMNLLVSECTHTQSHRHRNTNVDTHTHTHTCTHTHTHTHTHTLTLSNSVYHCCVLFRSSDESGKYISPRN